MLGRKKKKNPTSDCPQILLDLLEGTQSAWRKAIIKEFISLYGWKAEQSKKLERIDWEIKSILAVLIFIASLLVKILMGM